MKIVSKEYNFTYKHFKTMNYFPCLIYISKIIADQWIVKSHVLCNV